MAIHIDIDGPKYRNAVAEILRRHDRGEPEANITSAVRDFLILTGLARSEEMIEENPPSDASRRAVDFTTSELSLHRCPAVKARRMATPSNSGHSVHGS